jgi:hypothetical protein
MSVWSFQEKNMMMALSDIIMLSDNMLSDIIILLALIIMLSGNMLSNNTTWTDHMLSDNM